MQGQDVPLPVPAIFERVRERAHQRNAEASGQYIFKDGRYDRRWVPHWIEHASSVCNDGAESAVEQFQRDRNNAPRPLFVAEPDDVGNRLVETQIDMICGTISPRF